jgi:DNA-binding beta-propeller fold protein YncE
VATTLTRAAIVSDLSRHTDCSDKIEEDMLKKFGILTALLFPFLAAGQTAAKQPLKFIQALVMPDVPKGPYSDHLAVDLQNHRLFATPQAEKSVQVFDLTTGKPLHTIGGIENPHSVLYRSDLNQIYITDGGAGLLRVYNGGDYSQIKSVDNLPDADSIGYDPVTKYLYVTNGGRDAGWDHALLTVVDTTTVKRVADIELPALSPEAMAVESTGSHIYVDLMDKNLIAVVDRQKQKLVATWPVTKCKKPIAAGLDEANHRLFVGCRDSETAGTMDVFDTQTGKELETLPIGGWVDYIVYDSASHRIYASCGAPVTDGGDVYVFHSDDQGHYKLLAKVQTAPRAKTALLVPEIQRFFVSVPHFEKEARVLVYEVQ